MGDECKHQVNKSSVEAAKQAGADNHNAQCVKCGASVPVDEVKEGKSSAPKTDTSTGTE